MTGRPAPRPSPQSLAGLTAVGAEPRADGYPHPTSPAATAVMKGNRKRDTSPERALRSVLHRRGSRYRCDYPIRLDGYRSIRADIVFPRVRVAVFVDGCFWHRCPTHGSTPAANRDYWAPKLDRNVERDREADEALRAGGWVPVHVWEHEPPSEAAERVRQVVSARRPLASDRRPDPCRPAPRSKASTVHTPGPDGRWPPSASGPECLVDGILQVESAGQGVYESSEAAR